MTSRGQDSTGSGDAVAAVPRPWDVRAQLVERVVADLHGPLEGEHEVIRGYQYENGKWSPPGRVRDRYLVGMLAPHNTVANDAEREDGAGPEEGDLDPGAEDGRVGRAVLAQSSLGVTVVVEGTVTLLHARCRWGQYVREFEEHDDGSRAAVWHRQPQDITIAVPLTDGELGPLPVNDEGVVLRGRAAQRERGAPWLVTLFLANEQEQMDVNKDRHWLFQAALSLADPDGGPIFLGRDAVVGRAPTGPVTEQTEVAQLNLQYRDIVEHAVGHGVGTDVELHPADPRRAVRVTTVAIPRHEVGRTEAPVADRYPELQGLVTDMDQLAGLAPDELRAALRPLTDGYRAWLDTEEARLGDPAARLAGHEPAARRALTEAREVAQAIAQGIELVCDDPDALDAFRFANQAMHKQRVHTVATERRRADPNLTLRQAVAESDVAVHRSWRPFQLAFILLCIPSLTDPAHPDRGQAQGRVDLLFFPTGGGKTEAYLGLVAYTVALRRMQGIVGDGADAVDGRDGVAVLMRYTLRLLTAQQFQRAATLMCAAELLRQHRATTDARYAGTPFRLGMWVGAGVTPNTSAEAQKAVEDAQLGGRGTRANPLQLSSCPWCGQGLEAGTTRYDQGLARYLVFCSDERGECPFVERSAPREGLPVVTVDSEVYRLLPAFVIATIDKLAQLPWNGALATLFGRVDTRCERHGFRNPDLDRSHRSHWEERDNHKPLGDLPAARTVPVMRLRPPDLILQDEMHLVTGPLGTMAGLYETAVDQLATWSYQDRPVRPKVVASTATIRRAREQAWTVFWRMLRVFPPPVLDVHRSFFAEQLLPSPAAPGRLYLGICAHGERLKQVELRVFASVMAAAKAIWDELGDRALAADPWMTTVGYFNAVRELAGMRRMAEDELRVKLRRAGFTPGLASRPIVELEELTSRVSSEQIKRILQQLFIPHDPERGRDSDRPLDLLLATSMISVGVDVPRLASMVVVGQPKATAEYIQATSRVGRSQDGPGMVITLYNWARPRDLSHYESFAHYHATFYRQVEPLSVTPFSERALDKGLTGVLVSAVRQGDRAWNPNPGARDFARGDPRVDAHVKAIARRAAGVTGNNHTGELVRQMANRRLDEWDQIQGRLPDLSYTARTADDVPLLAKPEAGDWTLWTCPNSLRDTEVQANLQIFPDDPTYEPGSQPSFELGLHGADLMEETAADEDAEEAIETDRAEAERPEPPSQSGVPTDER